MSITFRTKLIRLAGVLLAIAAFAGSYNHSADWAAKHGPDGFWAYFTASIPEIMVVLAVLKALDSSNARRDPAVWVTGISAVAFTLWANGASAEPGFSGMVVAVWPAYAALMALWLMGHGAPEPEPTVTVTQIGPRPRKPRAVLPDQDPPNRVTARADSDLLAKGVAWVKAQPDYRTQLPSRPEIVKATGISDSTAKRVRAAVLAELYPVTKGKELDS